MAEEDQKLTAQQINEKIESDGLYEFLTEYAGPENIKDRKLSRHFREARDAVCAFEKALESAVANGDDESEEAGVDDPTKPDANYESVKKEPKGKVDSFVSGKKKTKRKGGDAE